MKEVDRDMESDGGDFEPTPEIVWQQSGSVGQQKVKFEAQAAITASESQ